MNQAQQSSDNSSIEEKAFFEFTIYLWQNRKKVIVTTIIFFVIGLLYTLLAQSSYRSEAIISPKEANRGGGGSSFLSRFGDLGGMVAMQLGVGENNLNRMELLIKGREIAESVINENNLLPKLFHGEWDDKNNGWKEKNPQKAPNLIDGIDKLRKQALKIKIDSKNNLMFVAIEAYDSVFAKELVELYLAALSRKIKNNVILEAQTNQDYLLGQMSTTTDPLLREKIQNMIAYEIERQMLVSSRSFDVLEKPEVPILRFRPKRKLLVVSFCMMGVFFSGGTLSLLYYSRRFLARVQFFRSLN